jgi:hypothetical protein
VISDFFKAYSASLDEETFKKLLAPVLSAAKSSNPLVRSGCIALFNTIAPATKLNDALGAHTVTELLALPKTGKTTGPEHRVVLYSMLASLSPSDSISPAMVTTLPGLLVKETHEPAISILAPALTPHLIHFLNSGQSVPGDIFAKEMGNAKPVIRRAFYSIVGDTVWQVDAMSNGTITSFIKSIFPALEASLKTVSANPTGAPAGPLEAYVAVAVMLGPLLRSGAHSEFFSSSHRSLSKAG